MTVRDALNSALDEELARDDKVYILGEEVCLCYACYALLSKDIAMAQYQPNWFITPAGRGVPGCLQGAQVRHGVD